MSEIRCITNRRPTPSVPMQEYSLEKARSIRKWHRSFPEYRETPLRRLACLAERLGVSEIYVKDESFRFGLNAFKALGGSYAIGRVLAERLGKDLSELPFPVLTGSEVRKELGPMTFVTATDGNHGRGVAWTASRLGQNSVVYMPKGSAPERLENIRALGSDASITDMCYDDAVRFSAQQAEKNGWILVQDTSWDGYEKIPGWIMEGYTTIGAEILEQLQGELPTHVFLQAGVGSMAGALAAFFANCYGELCPRIIVVEPHSADCFYRTAAADDGRLHAVTEEMNTIMAGLACGEPCGIAWDILQGCASAFLTISDEAAATGMRILGNPMGTDPRIISGESGASTFGTVAELLRNQANASLREALGLDNSARILCISTEGDTDRENYRRIVWDGLWAAKER